MCRVFWVEDNGFLMGLGWELRILFLNCGFSRMSWISRNLSELGFSGLGFGISYVLCNEETSIFDWQFGVSNS